MEGMMYMNGLHPESISPVVLPEPGESPVGFLGVGQMGLPIAQRLLRHGYNLRVFDPDQERSALLENETSATAVKSPSLLAFSCPIICSMIPDDAALQQVVRELSPLLTDGIHLSLSTISPQTARWAAQQYQQAGRGSTYVSAAVLGRPQLAAQGQLTVFVCGEASAKAQVQPLLECLGTVYDLGERIDAAPFLKLASNSLIVSALEAMGYASAFLRAAQLDPAFALGILARTPLFQGTVYQEYGQMIGHDVFEPARFPVPLGLKDVRLMVESARKAGTHMPLIELAHTHLLEAEQAGWHHLDWSVIGRVIAGRQPTQPLAAPSTIPEPTLMQDEEGGHS
jgi:3-hydroxyisobutyrate dehydrogenase-like beta-hydroxyacid dehydrogenase